MRIIDAHQHFWQFNPARDTWMTPGVMDNIRQDFMPEDLYPILDQHGIQDTIAVQVEQSEAENRFLLDLAEKYDWISGVVGWIDLRNPDIGERLITYRKEKKLVGFRHILQSEPPALMMDPDFIFGLEQLAVNGYTYDLLIYWHQMEEAIEMISQLPELQVVLDHIGKPDIRDARILKWRKGITRLAEMPNVYCKISGMLTEAHWQYWKPHDLVPYLDLTFQVFGTNRCMFGSDWPVCTLASTYQDWFEVISRYMQKFSVEEQEAIFSGNCKRFYRLDK
jgi:L-fuconolactonase